MKGTTCCKLLGHEVYYIYTLFKFTIFHVFKWSLIIFSTWTSLHLVNITHLIKKDDKNWNDTMTVQKKLKGESAETKILYEM